MHVKNVESNIQRAARNSVSIPYRKYVLYEIFNISIYILAEGPWLRVGRDDFNFLSWNLLASSHIAPVTERNTLGYMVLVWVVSYTQHKRYPCDRILYRGQKTGFWVSCCLNLIWCLLYPPNPPQLPRETLWTGWKRSWVRPTPPTNAHMVTENCPHWEETSKTRFVLFFISLLWIRSSQIVYFANQAMIIQLEVILAQPGTF